MLKSLKIKNIALISNINIEFENGLNVFTGETGTGKSIIIDSLCFLLGARADKNLIRHNETSARVDGVFDIDLNNSNIKNFFENTGIEPDEQLLISRTMNTEGKNEIRVNGEIITLSILKELCVNLVDVYGQNEQLNLVKPKYQLNLLDSFTENLQSSIYEFKNQLSKLKDINNQLNSLGGNNEQRARELDLLEFEIDEIEKANLSENEENELTETRNKLNNIEKISTLTLTSENLLKTAYEHIYSTKNNLINASKHDEELLNLGERLNAEYLEISDILDTIKNYNNNLIFDENEFNKIDARLEEYKRLKRKYGNSVELVLSYYNKIKQRYEILSNCDFEIAKLEKEKKLLLSNIFKLAENITNLRKTSALTLEQSIINNLQKLGMKNACVKFDFKPYNNDENSLHSNGCDEVELLFSANKGEELKPLKFVASGGEISRFMLALKSIIAEKDDMPTMIFDEIDTGISGLMAQAVAEQMAKISKNHQVLVITHTAQIASMADCNFLVEKLENENRTTSTIKKLSTEEKIEEISRFLSTNQQQNLAMENAKFLIKNQNDFKNSL